MKQVMTLRPEVPHFLLKTSGFLENKKLSRNGLLEMNGRGKRRPPRKLLLGQQGYK